MSAEIFPDNQIYKFLKVEEYFDRYQEWDTLGSAIGYSFNKDTKTLCLKFKRADNQECLLLVETIQNDTLRVRFNPTKSTESQYSSFTCLLENRNLDEADEEIRQNYVFDVDCRESNGQVILTTKSPYNDIVMEVAVTLVPFGIKVFNKSPLNAQYATTPVWQTADTSIYYTPHGKEDYAIIQAVKKPANGQYIGFGEQGGTKLTKNSNQLNYFNFDNMRYRQIYDRGPLDNREPLYHSEPFFYEFDGLPGSCNVNAILLDNPGQVFVDIGYSNSSRYMLGTRFGDLDYYLFLGDEPKNILDSFTALVGRAELKPRYALGYHQGCYGYECAADLKWAVEKYRSHNIPLDGLAVDVDLQDNYRTFTIKPDYQTNKNWPYEQTFGSHKEMFSWLRSQGVKCSTNITPVISSQDKWGDPNYYPTYKEGLENGYFVTDNRYDADNPDSKYYQIYGSGREFCPNDGWVEGYNSGEAYIGEVYYGEDEYGRQLGSPGHYSDFARPEVREWWGKQYTYLFEQGLEFVWQDMTTPAIRDSRGDMKGFPFKLYVSSDFYGQVEKVPALKVWNLYSYNLHKATYEGLNKLPGRENKRNFIIGRGSYVGSHRYAGLWTGDNSSDWDFLQMNIAQVLSLGMHALAISGQDIGGFEEGEIDRGKWANPELLMRWTAAGAFLPWFRNHYVRKGRKEFQEPFQYIDWFNKNRNGDVPEPRSLYEMVLPVCRHYIQLRYRLMQLFYDALFQNTLDGLPICRPLFLNDPQDQALYNDKVHFLHNEFFVRNDLLIAPVLQPESYNNNNGRRDVYVPQGSHWYGFVDNAMPLGGAVEGGTTIRDFDAKLSADGTDINFIVPIYVRAGAIIPTIELEQYVGQLNAEGKANPITLNVYPGQQGEYWMYLDDGVSRSSAPTAEVDDPNANNEYRETKISHSYIGEKVREIKVERIHDGYTPPLEQYFFVAILHDPTEPQSNLGSLRRVSVNSHVLSAISNGTPAARAQGLNISPQNAWYHNEDINISFIKVFDNNPSITITAEYI
ncbi:TIM-barrel domain-containing protein [Roseofilum casamattae]|uniref:Glycoside hydrolase family 31 protein n=1 Tax=Roseofilum casamattae BLCC-M143 TaxID=3022442 RepID=A0ABT7C286_9CYAN|nr:TIM-barrel domain-containing protein [Roseofilum casamattae]MDJ1185530.1 glycoside hydrolase family 31 protein [Roseofilum casamattae BLCC-M143]